MSSCRDVGERTSAGGGRRGIFRRLGPSDDDGLDFAVRRSGQSTARETSRMAAAVVGRVFREATGN